MKRANLFYITRQKRVNDLTKQMETVEVERQRTKLKKIIAERKNKWRQSMANKELRQPNFSYLKKDSSEFSFVECNASREPFISQKSKRLNFLSNRALSSSPNMKAGNPYSLIRNPQEIQNKVLLNKKFLQYDRIIDQDSALKKKQGIKKMNENSIYYEYPRKRITQMKKTFFQKMVPDKFNFYTLNHYNAIKDTMLSHSRTDNQMKSQNQILSKLRHVNSTIETQLNKKQSVSLDQSILKKSRSKTRKLLQFQIFQSSNHAKSRIKSQGSQILLPISFQKNLDSVCP